ncbi:MAG: acetyl-CoA decarbonylase/synthase complex subunit gamma [Deltaproteobacteria bacterium]|nr:MAG: acetyl-CoA decarbonylase/synthase complex subunit gamma [Deltaproteobacteria bacterium]
MPLSGTQIAKLLPNKKGCRECGFPTCFAFAMKLASGGTTLDKCPYLTPEAKAQLEEGLAPLMKLVTVGTGVNKLEIGDEEVVYRHEKTYKHPTGIAILISDKEEEAKVEEKVRKVMELQFTWIGLTLKADLVALQFESGDRSRFLALVKKVIALADLPLMLICEDTDLLFEAYGICADRRPLLYPITEKNIDAVIPKIKERPTPIVVRADGVAQLVPLTAKLKEEKIEEVVLDPGSKNIFDAIRDQTFIRRAAIKQEFRALGYPTVVFPCFLAEGGIKEAVVASAFIIKFAGIIVLSDFDRFSLFPLLVERLNIYTDPRIPMAVEAKVYEVGTPDEYSPVLVTSNWALTYFLVSTQIANSKVSAWLAVTESEGLGPLTAWAAGKFNGDVIAKLFKQTEIANMVKHKKLVIPGKCARIKGETEEALGFEWEAVVGPNEAGGIPAWLPGFAKQVKEGAAKA